MQLNSGSQFRKLSLKKVYNRYFKNISSLAKNNKIIETYKHKKMFLLKKSKIDLNVSVR